MSFLLISKALQLNNLKTRTAMNAKISVFVICVEGILYLSLYNLHDCIFKIWKVARCSNSKSFFGKVLITWNRWVINNMELYHRIIKLCKKELARTVSLYSRGLWCVWILSGFCWWMWMITYWKVFSKITCFNTKIW